MKKMIRLSCAIFVTLPLINLVTEDNFNRISPLGPGSVIDALYLIKISKKDVPKLSAFSVMK